MPSVLSISSSSPLRLRSFFDPRFPPRFHPDPSYQPNPSSDWLLVQTEARSAFPEAFVRPPLCPQLQHPRDRDRIPPSRPIYPRFGPGCSSIGFGEAVELGPLRVQKFGTGLEFNNHAWNKEANLLFLESPVGVGFSYTNTSSDLTAVDDRVVAKDAYSFLINWLRRFPQYQDHDFYISGESYGGHYVPQLAELVYERNKDRQKYQYINLKGFIVGNPETNDYYDYKGLAEYAWSHAVVSDQVYELINKVCDFRADNWSKACMDAMGIVMKQYHLIDFYNIYAPKCNLAQTTTTSPAADDTTEAKSKGRLKGRIRMYSGYDPCFFAYAEDYFNKIDVQRSLHANVSGKIQGKWTVCNDSIFYNTYKYTVFSVLPIYSKLIKGGLRIWVYSGDADGRVPVIGTRYCMDALGLPVKTHWQPWYHNKQVAGRFVEYEGLTMVTVRGAGHLVPLNKPEEALVLINSFLMGNHLPTHKSCMSIY
ncbi:serine carboxypeptidase-like 33 isoform X4 [Ananas comosus]|uniref:Carboxypeptidase n=1 Tax=Ananas comosus TaxID=4615 RepID=A0A6P5H1G8_ANACO|nr:serine carboxypeptidase-like 33 isoform X4 [Ananas comosus]